VGTGAARAVQNWGVELEIRAVLQAQSHTTLLQMVVRLIVRDSAGNTAESVNSNVSVQPRAGACGF
jgi:hypothetical protein